MVENATGPHYYSLHGLRMASSLEMPELTAAPSGDADVEILETDVPTSLGDDAIIGGYWQTHAGQFLFEAPDAARYLITEGRRIHFQSYPGQARDEHAIRLYLLGTALGALLHQRGLFPLHAGGLATPAGAWLFTGHSGAGKSTLVAWLHQRFGWPILSDDVTVIDDKGGTLRAHGGIGRLRLWRDALAALSIPEDGLVRDLVRMDKFQLLLGNGYSETVPLRGLVLLEACERNTSTLTRLCGHEALAAVMGSVYRPEFAELWRTPGNLFLHSARIAAGIQVLKFSRPRNLADYERHLETLIAGLDIGVAPTTGNTKPAGTNTATTG